VILRRASIAPVIVGIAFSDSFGVRKRCAGSFCSSKLQKANQTAQ
jgi:hypothetical protein